MGQLSAKNRASARWTKEKAAALALCLVFFPLAANAQSPSAPASPAAPTSAPDSALPEGATQGAQDAVERAAAQAQDALSMPAPVEIALPEGLVAPRVVTPAPAYYPQSAYDEGTEADVVLDVELDARGRVVSVEATGLTLYWYDDNDQLVEEESPLSADVWGFVPSAIASIRATTFSPALMVDDASPEGRPIPVIIARKVGFLYDEAVLEPDEGALVEGDSDPAASATGGDEVAQEPEVDLANAIDPYGPVNFEGEVMERGARRFLGGIKVTAFREPDGPRAETVTTPEGRFEFRGLPEGRWYVLIDEDEFKVFEANEEISRQDRASVRYRIEREYFDAYRSQTVEDPPAREVTRRTLDVQEIQRIPGTNNDAIRVVQNLPGVARAPFGGGDIIVRGSEGSDSGFYVDGLPIPTLYHFLGLRAVIPTEFIERLDFYPGNFGVRYGRASAGVLELETTMRLAKEFSGHFDVNVFDTGLYLEGPLSDRVSFQVGARRSYIDAVLSAVKGVIPFQLAVAPRYYDYQARILWQIADDHKASFMVYGSDDLVDLVLNEEDDLDPEVRGGFRSSQLFHAFQFRLDSTLSERLTHTFRAQVAYQSLGISAGDAFWLDLSFTRLAIRDELSAKLRDNLTLRVGVDALVTPTRVSARLPNFFAGNGEEVLDFESDSSLQLQVKQLSFEPAAYAEIDWRPIEALQLVPGIRVDYFNLPDQASLDARLSARYRINDRASVKAGIGNYHRSPDYYELADTFGNPDLGIEHVIQYSVGTELKLLDFLSFDVEVFYKDMRQLVSDSERLVTRNGASEREMYNNGGLGRVYGAEFFLRHQLANNFFGWITYTISKSERLDDGDSEWRLFETDQTHILSLLGTYNLPKNWSIGGRFRLISGSLTTPVVGAVYNSDTDAYTPVYGEEYSERLPIFHQLDIRVDKRWIFDAWSLNLYLDIQNVYNRQNPEGYVYSYDYASSQRVSGLPFIPSFGIRGEF